MTPDTVHYFGYGSLVNRATRPEDERCVNAVLSGWRRVWNHRIEGGSSRRAGCTSLSIEPHDEGDIAGVIVALPLHHLPQLDAREAGYDRLALPAGAFRIAEGSTIAPDGEVFVYRSRETNRRAPQAGHPVLQTYVDCVMAGYQERFGEPGLAAFLSSTRGWDGCRRDDRAAPDYPRAVHLPAERLAHFDAILRGLSSDEEMPVLPSPVPSSPSSLPR